MAFEETQDDVPSPAYHQDLHRSSLAADLVLKSFKKDAVNVHLQSLQSDVPSSASHQDLEEDDRSSGSASKRLKLETVLAVQQLDNAVARVSNSVSLAAILVLESLAKDAVNVQQKEFKLQDQLQIKLIVANRLVKVIEQEILQQRGLKTVRPSTSMH